MLNLSAILEDSARRFPLKPAFTFENHTYTYAQLNQQANRIANGLVSIGIQPGDKVSICCPNIPSFPIIYFGILKAGAVAVPLNIFFKKDEFIHHLADCDAKAFFCYEGTVDLPTGKYGLEAFNKTPSCKHFFMIMPEAVTQPSNKEIQCVDDLISKQSTLFNTIQTSAEDTAVIVYTSGTTGLARGAELSHLNLFSNAVISTGVLQSTPFDTQLVVLPLFHIFGMTVMMNAGIYKGLHSILLPRFDAATVYNLIIQHSISIIAGAPTMYWALLNYTGNLNDSTISGKLRVCISGGASLPVKVLSGFEKRFNVRLQEGYGMSEGSPVVTFNQLDIGCKPGSIGTPVWGTEVKVVNDDGEEAAPGEKGELVYRGPNVMKGYYNNASSTAMVLKNGWMHSGDIAVKDEDGFFFIIDRKKDIIIRSGYNIYPREVEEVMMHNEAVSMVAVVGVPDEKFGEEIKAFVVLKKGISIKKEQLMQWIKDRIAAYKYPRLIEFVNELPVSAAGKILKKDLRKTTVNHPL